MGRPRRRFLPYLAYGTPGNIPPSTVIPIAASTKSTMISMTTARIAITTALIQPTPKTVLEPVLARGHYPHDDDSREQDRLDLVVDHSVFTVQSLWNLTQSDQKTLPPKK